MPTMLGKRIKDARQSTGMSQVAVAKAAGIDRAFLSNIERDRKVPTVYVLLRICQAMGVSGADVIRLVEKDLRAKKRG